MPTIGGRRDDTSEPGPMRREVAAMLMHLEELGKEPRKRGGGPQSPEGKRAASRNSSRHGMRAKVIFPEDLEAAIKERTIRLIAELEPTNDTEDYLVGEIALNRTRIERCAELALADLQRVVDQAARSWDLDRRAAIEDLGARLAKDPGRVARLLENTRQGADFKIERWRLLAGLVVSDGGWNEAQHRVAFDLLGVPAELRPASGTVVPAGDDAAADQAALAAREIARLEALQAEILVEQDEEQREMAEAGMPLEEDRITRRLRRYEMDCRRWLKRAEDQFAAGRAAAALLARERARLDDDDALESPLCEGAEDYLAGNGSERPLGGGPVLGRERVNDWDQPWPTGATQPAPAAATATESPVVSPEAPVAAAQIAAPVSLEPTLDLSVLDLTPVVGLDLGPLPARTAAHVSAAPMTRRQRKALLAKAHKAARNRDR
jgi:hypothetical protein